MEMDFEQTPVSRTFVAAGAGAGKTRNLVEHIANTFVKVKGETGRAPRIVGTTFTRMAANEIKDRVALYAQNSENISDENLRKDLFDFAYSEALNITTIHGVCLQLLMKKGFLLGYSPDLKIVSKSVLKFYEKKILFDVIQDGKFEDIFSYFQFSDLLALFEQIDQKSMDLGRTPNLAELNALYEKVISEIKTTFSPYLMDLNENDFSNISTRPEEVVLFIKEAKKSFKAAFESKDLDPLKTFCETYSNPRQNISAKENADLSNLFNEFKKELTKLKNSIFDEKKYIQCFDKSKYDLVLNLNDKLFKIYNLYAVKLKKLKKQKSLVSMGEVENLTLEILTKFKEECQDYVAMWDYWYIDEYQDTSPIQNQIFNILLENKPYYKVGDPQQSIYLFRGAQASIFIEEMEQAKENPDIEFKLLQKNYRSHPNLMAGINELFEHVTEKSEDISESFQTMETKAEVDLDDGQRLNFIVVEPKDFEKQFVIDKIRSLNQSGIDLSEICILAHSRRILSEYEAELTQNNISCLAQFSGGFTSRPEIRGLACFLNVMDNPHQDDYLVQLLRSQFFKVEDSVLKLWMDNYKKSKLWSLWESLTADAEKDSTEIETLEDHQAIAKIKYFQSVFAARDYIEGLRLYLAETQVLTSAYNSMDLARRNANLYKVHAFACQKSEVSGYNLNSLITDLESGGVEELESEAVFSQSKNGVRLFTIHGSKGLEFKHVFLVGSAADRRPKTFVPIETLPEKKLFIVPIRDHRSGETVSTVLKYFSKEERTTNEKKEARRVIYVAATRAEENLYVVGGVKRNKKGDLVPGTESLYKVIDINAFATKKLDFISVDHVEDINEVVEVEESTYSYLDFENCNNSRLIEDLDKKLFVKPKIEGAMAKKLNYIPMSVSQMVEVLSKEKLKFKELNRQKFVSVNLTDIYNPEFTKSKAHMDVFLKPFIGDVFHKSIELYSTGVSDTDLIDFISNYFPESADKVLVLIKNISKLDNPNMNEIFSNSKSEWGFNALYKKNILLSGQIDLWGFDSNDEIHIVDYKTGSSSHKNKATIQVFIYKDILQQIYPDTKIHTHLLYVSEGEFITVEGTLNQ